MTPEEIRSIVGSTPRIQDTTPNRGRILYDFIQEHRPDPSALNWDFVTGLEQFGLQEPSVLWAGAKSFPLICRAH